MTLYLTNFNNENLSINVGYEAKAALTLIDMPSDDVSADVFKFDIGVEGDTALLSGDATILSAVEPVKILVTIPEDTFTKPLRKLILQIRWTPDGGNEKIIVKRFFDVRNPITPAP